MLVGRCLVATEGWLARALNFGICVDCLLWVFLDGTWFDAVVSDDFGWVYLLIVLLSPNFYFLC